MTKRQKIERKIHKAEVKARLAEDYYQFATINGSIEERDNALRNCFETRAKLKSLLNERETMKEEINI